MFLGHFAVGFAGKKFAKETSLGTLFASAQFLDLIWPIFLLLGIETVAVVPGTTVVTPFVFDYPYSHSLVAAILWSSLFYLVFKFIFKNKTALVLGIAVFSHWLLDFFTHAPDLPLFLNNTVKVGLGLWNSLYGTLIVELSIFVIGIYLYHKTTKAKDRIGSFGLWGVIAFLTSIYLMSIFGPPPPDDTIQLAAVGLSQWLIILLIYWIDKHRLVRE